MVTLTEQLERLIRIAEEIGPDPALSAAIKTLNLMRRFEQPVRETLAKCITAVNHPATQNVLREFADAQVAAIREGAEAE